MNSKQPKVYKVDLNTEEDEDPIEFVDNKQLHFVEEDNKDGDEVQSLSELNEISNASDRENDFGLHVVKEVRSEEEGMNSN